MPMTTESAHPMPRRILLGVLSCLALGVAACTDGELPPDDGSAGSSSSGGAPLGLAPFESTMLVHVYYETQARLDRLVTELDVLEHADHREGYVAALVEPDDYERLVAEGLRVEVQQEPTSILQRMLDAGGFRSIPSYACYRTVEETNTTMATLATDHADLVQLVDLGDSWDKVTPGGAAGYDLQGMVVTNETIAGPKPRFFLMGAIHAREYATAEIAIRFAEQLVEGYGSDPDATWLLDHYELHVLPHTNPDGRKIAELGYTQRKNRNTTLGACSYPPTASSQHGIDLNRNHSFKYGGAGTSTSACNLTYRGPAAISEPETQALQSYMSSIFTDQRGPGDSDPAPADTTGLMISLHSYSPLVLFPWSWSAVEAPNLAQLRTLGRKFGFHNNYPVCQGPVCLYAASGSSDDWAYGELGIAAYTFEVGTSFFQDCTSFESTIAPDNLAALTTAFKAARRPYQTPSGADATAVSVSASPVTAGASVTLTATADDTRYDSNGWGTEPTQAIAAARFSVDHPSWTTTPLTAMAPSDGTFDTSVEGVTATLDTTGWLPGRYLLMVEGRDAHGNWGAPSAVFLDVEAAGGTAEVCGNALDDDSDALADCTDPDCLGTPACAVPEVCDDTTDDDGDGDTDCDDADCTDDPACAPPAEICDNALDDDGDALTDCTDPDCTGDPACPPAWTVLSTTDFESGWGIFIDGGVDAARLSNASYAHGGTFSAEIRDDSGVPSSFYSTAFDLSGYTELEIDFWYYARSMEAGEDFFVELWSGSSWQVIGHYVVGTDFANNTMSQEVIAIDSTSFVLGSAAQLRFRADASADNDLINVDDVTISAR